MTFSENPHRSESPKEPLSGGYDNPGTFIAPSGAAPPAPNKPPATIGPYEILGEIGRGAMGVVFLARRTDGTTVALKILYPELAADPKFVARFDREAHLMRTLKHPAIVPVLDHGSQGEFRYIAMEHIQGSTLRQSLKRGPLQPRDAVKIVRNILSALDHAHDAGVIHRDVKPENVLLDAQGGALLSDFGIAHVSGHTLTATGASMGTPHYMAPEQLNNPETADRRIDIYAVGILLYELLTGEIPVGRFQPASKKASGTTFLDHIILKATSQDPAHRYSTAQEMLDELSNPQVLQSDGYSRHRARQEWTRDDLVARRDLISIFITTLVFAAAILSGWVPKLIGLLGIVALLGFAGAAVYCVARRLADPTLRPTIAGAIYGSALALATCGLSLLSWISFWREDDSPPPLIEQPIVIRSAGQAKIIFPVLNVKYRESTPCLVECRLCCNSGSATRQAVTRRDFFAVDFEPAVLSSEAQAAVQRLHGALLRAEGSPRPTWFEFSCPLSAELEYALKLGAATLVIEVQDRPGRTVKRETRIAFTEK